MTNVVQLRQPSPPAHYLLLTTLIDPNPALEEGDLVAFQWIQNGVPGTIMFSCWRGPTGGDGNGHFVKKGSPDEHFELDHLKYRVKDLGVSRHGYEFKILGKVLMARDDGARLTPPPKAG